ncbi:hypothetical protein F0562_025563 [Nyssa sinensis]|uniref:Uncharacterized protein n=1 Tax=Nyssa sinensis TaxID=561372 RepID=A0A5J5BCC9_9ASTE|nr:hypothetical protein F0562_025563 [Nyssa sinensis]
METEPPSEGISSNPKVLNKGTSKGTVDKMTPMAVDEPDKGTSTDLPSAQPLHSSNKGTILQHEDTPLLSPQDSFHREGVQSAGHSNILATTERGNVHWDKTKIHSKYVPMLNRIKSKCPSTFVVFNVKAIVDKVRIVFKELLCDIIVLLDQHSSLQVTRFNLRSLHSLVKTQKLSFLQLDWLESHLVMIRNLCDYAIEAKYRDAFDR